MLRQTTKFERYFGTSNCLTILVEQPVLFSYQSTKKNHVWELWKGRDREYHSLALCKEMITRERYEIPRNHDEWNIERTESPHNCFSIHIHTEWYSEVPPPSTNSNTKKLSLTKRDRIIMMTNATVSGTKTIYSVTTKLLTNRGDRSNPDSTMHTWNHSPSGCTCGTPKYKSPPKYKARASWKTPRWLALDDR